MEGIFASIVQNYVSKFIGEIMTMDSITEEALYESWNNISGVGIPLLEKKRSDIEIEEIKTPSKIGRGGCIALFKSGKNKGRACGKILPDGETYCKRHAPISDDKKTCNHTLTSGSKCRKIVKLTEYCNVHEKQHNGAEIINCGYELKSGELCKKNVSVAGDRCNVHKKKEEEKKEIEIDDMLNELLEDISPEQQIYEFKEEDLSGDDYAKIPKKRMWRHKNTNYCVGFNKKTGKYVLHGIFGDEDTNDEIYYISKDDVLLLTGIDVDYEEDDEDNE